MLTVAGPDDAPCAGANLTMTRAFESAGVELRVHRCPRREGRMTFSVVGLQTSAGHPPPPDGVGETSTGRCPTSAGPPTRIG